MLNLNAAAENALAAYCNRHKVSASQAARAILAEASYAKMRGGSGRRYDRGKPPLILPGTPLPALSDGRIQESEKRRGKLFGHHEVIVTRYLSVALDGVSYLGLLRTMEAKKITRQEAARYLIIGRQGTFIGQWVPLHEE